MEIRYKLNMTGHVEQTLTVANGSRLSCSEFGMAVYGPDQERALIFAANHLLYAYVVGDASIASS